MISERTSDDWGTPDDVYARYAIPGTLLDAAANAQNRKTHRFYGPGSLEAPDALGIERWDASCPIWCNPPYSKGFQQAFVEKAMHCRAAVLLPCDTSTRLFSNLAWGSYGRCIILIKKGRITFVGAPGPAKFGSMIVYFNCRREDIPSIEDDFILRV